MPQTIGSRRQVWNGTAKRTSGGLSKSDLMMSHGRIVSKAKHTSAKKEMRLLKYGYGTQKGKFGFVKLGRSKGRSRKMRGGMGALSPAEANWEGYGISGAGITDYSNYGSVGVQERAGMTGGTGMKSLSPPGAASWNGDSSLGSVGLQLKAGMSGGRRRRRRQRR
jgi:hypothetical protein